MLYVPYFRVSSNDQNLDRQEHAFADFMKEHNISINDVPQQFKEKVSGKNITDRSELQNLLRQYAHPGVTIVVQSLDRLSRNYDDIQEIVRLILKGDKEKEIMGGARFKVLDAPFLDKFSDDPSLNQMMFDMFLPLLSYIADNERKKILERQKQGIEIAKQKGRYKGRQIKYRADAPDKADRATFERIVDGLRKGETIKHIADTNGVPRKTVYVIKEREAL